MPRPLRIHVPGGFYHVTLRGNHQQVIFHSDSDRLLLNVIVAAAIEKHSARVHAYCWMTNHLHFLMQVGTEPLAPVMRDIASGYARAFQKKLRTTGHLFERRFHAILVDENSYLLELLRYIHLNPVTAFMVNNPDEYRWSSHHAFLGGMRDPWVTTDFALRMFADTPARARARYREFVECDVTTLKSPLDEARGEGGQFLGSDDFILRSTTPLPKITPRVTLDDIVTMVCAEFGIGREVLRTTCRHESIARIRARVTARALEAGAANLSEVARELGCDRKTLREAVRRFGDS